MEENHKHNPEEVLKLFSFLSKKYTLAILYEAFHYENIRFGQLEESLPGISSRTLSIRLTELEENRFIDRNVSKTKPVIISYSLTKKARDLQDVFFALGKWTLKWSKNNSKN
ncbi:MAG: helix-turn-helix transcriptional regulator [Leptospiraceae bacterium]|nr:helix-turn-helix transcriptional regulator [Leptospiraceae bacterium]